MNLHEECLLKYLSNPLALSCSTEALIKNNKSLAEIMSLKSCIAKHGKISYTTGRIGE